MEDCYICDNDIKIRPFCSRPHIHELKIWTIPFEAILSGEKLHEVRKADRIFFYGDFVRLKEYIPKEDKYTGRELFTQITYVTEPGTWGLPTDLCVFSFKVLKNGK